MLNSIRIFLTGIEIIDIQYIKFYIARLPHNILEKITDTNDNGYNKIKKLFLFEKRNKNFFSGCFASCFYMRFFI